MRTLHMSEVIQHIDQSVTKRKEQSDQLHTVWESLNNLAGVESFKGQTAVAIKNNIKRVQIPTAMALYQSLDQWVEKANKLKEDLLSFENENGIYTEEFITHDVTQSLQNVGDLTVAIINQINNEISSVSHLTSSSTIGSSEFIYAKNEALLQIENNQSAFGELDTTHQQSFADLKKEISHLKKLLSNIKSWQSEGKSFDSAAITNIDDLIYNSDTLKELSGKGLELAIKEGDASFAHHVSTALDWIGKGQGGIDVLKGLLTIGIISSKTVVFNKVDNAYRVTVSEKWKNKNGKYESKFASTIKNHFNRNWDTTKFQNFTDRSTNAINSKTSSILNKVSKSENLALKVTSLVSAANNKIQDTVVKFTPQAISKSYNGVPGNVVKHYLGLKNVTKIKPLTIAALKTPEIAYKRLFPPKNSTPGKQTSKLNAAVRNLHVIDRKETLKKIDSIGDTTKSVGKAGVRKVPVLGIVASIGINMGEFANEENKNKTGAEKTGRFLAGIGSDIAVSGATMGGAAIGTMICPGVGTLIGGAIGAGVSITATIAWEDEIKDFGEAAGRFVENSFDKAEEVYKNTSAALNDAVDSVSNKLNDVTKSTAKNVGKATSFVKGFFK